MSPQPHMSTNETNRAADTITDGDPQIGALHRFHQISQIVSLEVLILLGNLRRRLESFSVSLINRASRFHWLHGGTDNPLLFQVRARMFTKVQQPRRRALTYVPWQLGMCGASSQKDLAAKKM